jgi:recombination protein RecR
MLKSNYKGAVRNLIDEFNKMPGIGVRTAERLAFYVLKSPFSQVKALSAALLRVKEAVRFCKICNNLSEGDVCDICGDDSRDKSVICVVEDPKDVNAVEKTHGYKGLYHVLLGTLSPLDGIGPSDLKINELVERLKKNRVKEVIIATNFNTEGEATAVYLSGILRPLKIKVSRVAYGIPVGSNIEYTDQATMVKALEGRKEI